MLLSFLSSVSGAETAKKPPPDAFAKALADIGMSEADLGYRPLGHWNRYPHPNTTPYVMPFFNDLFARPLDTYEFARTLGNAVEDALTPQALREKPESLYRLGVVLATERRIGGFRAYGANLDPHPAAEEPLLQAVLTLLEQSGQSARRDTTFGKTDVPHADPLAALRTELAAIPAGLHPALAKLILNLLDAHTWVERGLRRLPQELRDAVFDALPQLAEHTPDGSRYYPAIDDVARLLDEHSLWYGCLKALQATQEARRDLEAVPPPDGGWLAFEFRATTPWGTVLIDRATEGEQSVNDPLLIVRFGATPLRGSVGASGRRRPLSVALLLGATPAVGCADGDLRRCPSAALATGILGCGIVYAGGEHATAYRGNMWGLGAGLFGLGVLVDEGGDDDYRMRSVGMGAAFFGAGLLLDAGGNDHYRLDEGDGEGFGGPGGVGVLADRSGNDTYYVEPDAAKAGRADYHSDYKIAVSNAQGAGTGRRGDGSDGHAWAGGLGALLDVDGDDAYRAGNFSLGIGYWYGTGIVWDGGGNDDYRSVYYTQGSGAHFAIGALIDEGGDDSHVLGENAGAGLGFGWDVVNGMLIDRGGGSDRYEAKYDAIALATKRSNAFLLDEGGNDTYVLDENARGFGDVDRDDLYVTPGRTATFAFHLPQVALLLDAGGTDTYSRRKPDGSLIADPHAGNNRTWHVVKKDQPARAAPNRSIGVDVARGRIGFLDPWPARVPAPPAEPPATTPTVAASGATPGPPSLTLPNPP
jgi:hypothetical protein